MQVRHIYNSSQCFDKTPEVTCAGQKHQRFRRHIIHKCTQMYLFIKEPVCDTDDSRQQTHSFLDSCGQRPGTSKNLKMCCHFKNAVGNEIPELSYIAS